VPVGEARFCVAVIEAVAVAHAALVIAESPLVKSQRPRQVGVTVCPFTEDNKRMKMKKERINWIDGILNCFDERETGIIHFKSEEVERK
jgi:hypothetical protein